jgi:CRP-like cAMP-binding protein
MPRPLEKFLRRLLLRSELSPAARTAILAVEAPLVSKRARWDIVRTGQVVSTACLVDAGIVGRSEQFADGSRRTAAYYVPGDMCDLHSVAVPTAGWNITALTDCRVYEVPHEALRELFVGYPEIAMAFWRDTTADSSILAKMVTILSGLSARERVAHVLCEFGVRMQTAKLGSRLEFPFPLTQAQLAELVGTTTVHMSRIIQQLSREGVLVQRRGSIEVKNLPLLERIAEYDPQYLLLEVLNRAAPAPLDACPVESAQAASASPT